MIQVAVKPEPPSFNVQVRIPGKAFLAVNPNPKNSKEWSNREYWQRSLPDLRSSYNKICSYCAQWIPHGTGSHSVDHFQPKSSRPDLAYEWSNLRYVSSRFNSRKRIKQIVDPFEIDGNWFELDFSSLFVHPNSQLDTATIDRIKLTIDILKLNEDDLLVEERQEYFTLYSTGDINFDYLKSRAPFIASEVIRQRVLK